MNDPEEDYYRHNYIARKAREDRERRAAMTPGRRASETALRYHRAVVRTRKALRRVFGVDE